MTCRPSRLLRDRAWLAAVLLLLAATGNAADESAPPGVGAVEGVVRMPDGRAIAGVRVVLLGAPEAGSTSDSDGRFLLSEVPAGSYWLRAELEGFGRREQAVEVGAGVTRHVSVTLPYMPFSEMLTVTATRGERRLEDSPADLTVLTREDLQRWPAAAADDVLKHVPSFSLFRRTSSLVSHPTTQGVSLRGVGASGASRTLVLVDGVPHNDPFGNWVYWDDVPQVQIETIEAAPSGLSFLYGSSAMAGVIHVETRRPQPSTAALQATGGSRGSWDAQGFGSHALGPFSAAIGGSFFETDGYVLVGEQERGAVDVEAASRHRTGNWRLEYSASPRLTFFHNGRVFAEDRENGTPLQTNSTRQTYLGGGMRATTEGGSRLGANVFAHSNDFESTFTAVASDRASETLSLAQAVDYRDLGGNVQWARPLGAAHELGIGGDLRWIEADNAEDVFIPTGANVRDRLIPAEQLYAGGYLEDVITLGERAVVSVGVRMDHWRNYDASQTEIVNATGSATVTPFPETSKTTVTPRAGVLFRARDGLAVRGAAYGGFRAPSLNELYRPFRVGNVLTQANPDLGPERLAGGELGLNHDPSPAFSWRATAFWDEVKDPIANATVSVTPELITRKRMNLGRARVRGVSFESRYQPVDPLRIQVAYVLSSARVTEFEATPEIEGNLLPQVPRHRASLRLDWLHPRVLEAGLRARFESLRYDDDQNRLELASLFLVDLMVERRLGESWRAFVSAENVFDHRYPVQATPVEQLGTPFTITAGVRFDLRPR